MVGARVAQRMSLRAALAAGVLLSAAAPAGEGHFEGTGAPGGSIAVALPAEEIRTFLPWRATDPATRAVLRLTTATLVRLDRVSGVAAPGLAVSWDSDETGCVWTFRMRPDAVWSDGVPLTAADAVFSIRAVTDPANDFPILSALGRGETAARAAAEGPRTLRVTLPAPRANLPALLAFLPILPEHKLADAARHKTLGTAWGVETRDPAAALVGAGPYLVQEYRPKERVTLVANSRYWRRDAKGQALPYTKTVTFLLAGDAAGAAQAFAAGEADLVEDVDASLARALAGAVDGREAAWVRGEGETAAADLLVVNVRPGTDLAGRPVASPERAAILGSAPFRRALALSLDRRALAALVPLEGGVPARGWPPVPDTGERDPAAAAAALAAEGWKKTAAGWIDPAGRPAAFSLLAGADETPRRMAEELARQWKAFGFDASVDVAPASVVFSAVAESGAFETALVTLAWEPGLWAEALGGWIDPTARPSWARSGAGDAADGARPAARELADAWTSVRSAPDAASRERGLAAAGEALVRESPLAILCGRRGIAALRGAWRNLRPAGFWSVCTWNLEEVWRQTPR